MSQVFIAFTFFSLCFNSAVLEELTPIKPIFAPYIYDFKSVRNCREPRPTDLVKVTHIIQKKVPHKFYLFVNMTFHAKLKIDFARIIVYRFNENSKKVQVFDHRTQKPCEHFIWGPCLKLSLNVTSNCIVRKGFYSSRIDINSLMDQLTSNRTIVGHYEYFATLTSKKKQIHCTRTRIDLLPIEEGAVDKIKVKLPHSETLVKVNL